jgi:serine/threonine protein kinase
MPADELPTELRDHVRYRILKKLGEGGMGAVYLAEHKLMNRTVALKLIRSELAAQPHLIQRFHREVQAAARMSHPNIVHAYDAEQAGSCHFLVMEYVEGTDLARLLKEQGPLSLREACQSIHQAALGLQHAHEHQLIHRDLKPQNLMRTAQGQVKILDFGLARAVQHAQQQVGDGTASGMILGTPDYMAPEQADDAGHVDIRADIYSLGCTLYHLLSGRVPFPGQNMVGKLAKHASTEPTRLDELRPGLPSALVQVIAKMMAKDPAARYQTPADVVTALEPWCQDSLETVEFTPVQKTSTSRLARRAWILVPLAVIAGLAIYFLQDRLHRNKNVSDDSSGSVASGGQGSTDKNEPQLVVDDDFGGGAKLPFFPPGEEADRYFEEHRGKVMLEDKRLIVKFNYAGQDPRFTACGPKVECADFVCEVQARIEGKGDTGWAIFHDDGGETTLWVMVRLDGRVEINESGKTVATAFRHALATLSTPVANSTDGLTTLKVQRKGQELSVFVNGEPIGEPLQLERKYATGTQFIGVWTRGAAQAKVEFARYKLWKLP